MNHIALPSKGSLQSLIFWIGMYFVAIFFTICICLSVFYAISSMHWNSNKQKTSQHQSAPASKGTLALEK